MIAPLTPDFSSYPMSPHVVDAQTTDGRVVATTWSDGTEHRFLAFWLRDNCTDPGRGNDTTNEQLEPFEMIPPDLRADAVWIDEVDQMYTALRVWTKRVNIDRYAIQRKLDPGDLIAVDNRRMLCGRTAFSLESGRRWLVGTHFARDDLGSALRVGAR